MNQGIRNTELLDNPQPEDSHIGELKFDGTRPYRIVAGAKVWQMDETDQSVKDMNLIINRVRVSGLKPMEYLKKRATK